MCAITSVAAILVGRRRHRLLLIHGSGLRRRLLCTDAHHDSRGASDNRILESDSTAKTLAPTVPLARLDLGRQRGRAVAKANRSTGVVCVVATLRNRQREREQEAEFPTWSQRIGMDHVSEEEIREEYDGKNLAALIAQWEPAVGDRAYAQTKAFMNAVDQEIWTEAKTILFSTTGDRWLYPGRTQVQN